MDELYSLARGRVNGREGDPSALWRPLWDLRKIYVLKILYWDRDGWAIWYRLLEEGTFQSLLAHTGRREIASWELGLRLEGIDLSKGRQETLQRASERGA